MRPGKRSRVWGIQIAEEEQEEMPIKEAPPLMAPPEVEPSPVPVPEEDPCRKIADDVAGFFRYLDQKKYLLDRVPEPDSYARFKRILRQLEADPPGACRRRKS